jgi:hypothetical protein
MLHDLAYGGALGAELFINVSSVVHDFKSC